MRAVSSACASAERASRLSPAAGGKRPSASAVIAAMTRTGAMASAWAW